MDNDNSNNNSPSSGSDSDRNRLESFASIQTTSANVQDIVHGTNSQASQSRDSTQKSFPSTSHASEDMTGVQSENGNLQDNEEAKDDGDGNMDVDSDSDSDMERDVMDIEYNETADRLDDNNNADLPDRGISLEHGENDLTFANLDFETLDEPVDDYDLSPATMYDILETMADEAQTAAEKFNEQQQKDLDLISQVTQVQYLRQPVSTQIVLTREAATVFKQYGQHGSAARLSESVMRFLEGGDRVERRLKQTVMKMTKVGPLETGQPGYKEVLRAFEQIVREGARIKFAMLREEIHGVERYVDIKHKEKNALQRPQVHVPDPRKIAVPRSLMNKENTGEKRSAHQWNKSDTNDVQLDPRQKKERDLWEEVKESEKYEVEVNVPATDEIMREHSFTSNSHFAQEQEEQPNFEDGHIDLTSTSSIFPTSKVIRDANNTVITANNLIPPLESLAPYPAILTHDSSQTLTSDPETHALLSDPDAIPFHPIDLVLTLEQGTYFPPSTLESVDHILQIYTLASHDLLRHLTLSHTPTSPLAPSSAPTIDPHFHTFPAPPLALFRLASSQYFSEQVSSILQPTSADELFMSPQSRALMRGVYDSLQPGALNHVEAELLQRACRLGGMDSVEVFWEERNANLKAWIAVKAWRRKREMERIKRARLEGRYW